jgi:hypothetical protein
LVAGNAAHRAPERTDAFYTRMYIRLLPVNLDIRIQDRSAKWA